MTSDGMPGQTRERTGDVKRQNRSGETGCCRPGKLKVEGFTGDEQEGSEAIGLRSPEG